MHVKVGCVKQILDTLTICKHLFYPNEVDLWWLARFRVVDNQSVFINAHKRIVTAPQIGLGHVRDSQHLDFFRSGVKNIDAMLSLELRAEDKEFCRVCDESRLCIGVIVAIETGKL